MAVLKSNLISAADNPDIQIPFGAYVSEKVCTGKITTPSSTPVGDVILLVELPVDAKLTSARFWADSFGAMGKFALGLYPGVGSGVNIVDSTDALDEGLFASSIEVKDQKTTDRELRFDDSPITTIDLKLWQVLGLAERPDYGTFFLALTICTGTSTGGSVAAVVRYIL